MADCAQVLFMVLGVGAGAGTGGMNVLLGILPRPEDDCGSKAGGHWLLSFDPIICCLRDLAWLGLGLGLPLPLD